MKLNGALFVIGACLIAASTATSALSAMKLNAELRSLRGAVQTWVAVSAKDRAEASQARAKFNVLLEKQMTGLRVICARTARTKLDAQACLEQ